MRHTKQIALAVLFGSLLVTSTVFAQGMMGWNGNTNQAADTVASDQTAKEEAEGKALWDKLQSKQTTCAALTDDNFDKLGDYFMGLMMGGNHASMNESMKERIGDAGETQMHIAMGKRLSGCDPAAAYPSQGSSFVPMMGWSSMHGGAYGRLGSFGWFGYGFTIVLVWTLLILGIIVLAKSITKKK